MDIRPLLLDVFTTYQFPNLKYLVIDESKVYYEKIQRFVGEEESDTLADLSVNEENGNNVISQNNSEEQNWTDTKIFIEKINKLMLSIFRKSPHLEAIEFESDYSLDTEAFTVFFQSCLHFHQLRYVSFYSYSPHIVSTDHFHTLFHLEVLKISFAHQ